MCLTHLLSLKRPIFLSDIVSDFGIDKTYRFRGRLASLGVDSAGRVNVTGCVVVIGGSVCPS